MIDDVSDEVSVCLMRLPLPPYLVIFKILSTSAKSFSFPSFDDIARGLLMFFISSLSDPAPFNIDGVEDKIGAWIFCKLFEGDTAIGEEGSRLASDTDRVGTSDVGVLEDIAAAVAAAAAAAAADIADGDNIPPIGPVVPKIFLDCNAS